MNEIKNEHGTLIAVSDGSTNKLFVGWTKASEEEINCAMMNYLPNAGANPPIYLHDARVLRELTVPTPQGIAISIQVVPYSACAAGVDLTLRQTHYFWPKGVDARKILSLIDTCEKDELKARANQAGITTPNGMRVGPDGRMTQ